MVLQLAPEKALISAIQRSMRSVAFLVGSPLSMPQRPGEPGVPGTDGILQLVEQQRAGDPELLEEFKKAIDTGDAAGKYQRAMHFLQTWGDQDQCNAVIKEAVLRARRPGARPATEQAAEADRDGWHINEGTQALADLLVHCRDRLSGLVLTPNFDPLLSIAIARAGGTPHRIILDQDGGLGQQQIDASNVCTVVHFHGYWSGASDTMHTPAQLLAPRPRLGEALTKLLKDHLIVTIAYGGWDDVFTRAGSGGAELGPD